MDPFISGEFVRTLDERYRITLPAELVEPLLPGASPACILAKERYGCLSLWAAEQWRGRIDEEVEIVRRKLRAGHLQGKLAKVQELGRLLSSRHRAVRLGQRTRLVIPEGFREYLAVEPNAEAIVIGAALSVEIWHPRAWKSYLKRRIPEFNSLLKELIE